MICFNALTHARQFISITSLRDLRKQGAAIYRYYVIARLAQARRGNPSALCHCEAAERRLWQSTTSRTGFLFMKVNGMRTIKTSASALGVWIAAFASLIRDDGYLSLRGSLPLRQFIGITSLRDLRKQGAAIHRRYVIAKTPKGGCGNPYCQGRSPCLLF